MHTQNYSSDSPVTLEEEDSFSRWNFSKSVAQVISKRRDPSSIVIAINGAWGDGKTSVLNFVEQSLNEDVICIRFNPWRFGDEDQLLKGFFKDIAEALDTKLITKGDKLKDILKKSASGVGAVAGVKGVGDSISSFLTGPDIEELKKRIEEELETAQKRVLILIDDIDRLEKSEIHTLFRLVKLTANFKYTSYILAFDKDVVAASLQEKYSGANENAGEAFLEKIIQVPLHLPPIEKETLRKYCFSGVEEALSIAEIKLSEIQIQEFVRNFTVAFDEAMSTPRKAKLYGNSLIFSLPILKGEVNPVDLMLIEGIRVFCPRLYMAIRNHKGFFTGSFSQSMRSTNDDEKVSIQKTIDLSLENIENKDSYISLLQEMFPKLQAVYGNMYFDNHSYEEWNQEQRICSKDYFSRYFSYSVLNNDIADKVISDIIDVCVPLKEHISKNNNPLTEIITAENTEILIKKLRYKSSNLSQEKSESLAYAVSSQCSDYPNPAGGFPATTTFEQAAILISDLVQNIDLNDRIEVIKNCITKSEDINFKFEIFRWLKKEKEDNKNLDVLSDEQVSNIKNHISVQIKTYIDEGVDITSNNRHYVYRIFDFLIFKYSQEIVDNYIQEQLRKNAGFIVCLLDSYTGITTNSKGIVRSDFEMDSYKNITSQISPDFILPAIEEHIGVASKEGSYPHDYEGADEHIQLKQFLWLHAKNFERDKEPPEK